MVVAAQGLRKHLTGVAIFGILAVLVAQFIAPSPSSLHAQGLGPVLKIASQPGGGVPFLAEALRDPEILRRRPEDAQDATRLAHDLKEFRDDLTRSKGERAAELNGEAYEAAGALAYYFEDAAAGRTNEKVDRNQMIASLKVMRSFVTTHAAAHVKLTTDAQSKARAQFNLQTTRFAMGERGQAVSELRQLATVKGLGADLKRRALFIAAVHDAEGGAIADRKKAIATLAKLAPGMAAEGQVAARLVMARSLAGGATGKGVDQKYRSQLWAASVAAEKLADNQKAQVLGSIIGIWRGTESGNAGWDKPPFKLAAFSSMMDVKAIVERSALADWSAGKRDQALRKYASLSKSLTGMPVKGQIDLRYLDLKRMEAAHTKSPRSYEQALTSLNKQYLDTGILGDGNETKAQAMTAEIAKRYETLVMSELARVSTASAQPKERAAAIAMAHNFLANTQDDAKIEAVKARVAGLYAMNKLYREAVDLYKELGAMTKGEGARKYWSLAIAADSILANWPTQAPWSGVQAGNAAAREELLGLYAKIAELNGKKNDWFVTAQMGLLQVELGQADQAFASWEKALAQDARGPHAAAAAGTMLVAYQKASDWTSLEKLARLCLKQQVAASYRGKTVAAVAMLEVALLEGAKDAMEAQKYAVAVKKLQEFVKEHPSAKNHDEGFYLLAVAYRGNGQHQDSIKTLLSFVDRYPASQFTRPALLNGGDWSAPMAFEDNAMYFYQKFVTGYSNDQEAPRVRDLLSELYLGRGRYADGIAVLNAQVMAKNTDAATKGRALVTIMDTEERQGSVSRAEVAADQIIRAEADEASKTQAYSLKIRHAARAGNYAEVQRLEQAVSAVGSGASVQDVIGEARYYVAVAHGKQVVKQYFNLALTDPGQTLEKRYEAFKTARAAYTNVCAAGQTSYCAASQHQLARLSEDFIGSLEDIAIQENLAKSVVQRFKLRKQAITNDAARTSQSADNQAMKVVGQGYTDPDWTQAVLWQNTSEWNIDRVSGEAGNGYVQWSHGDGGNAEVVPAAEVEAAE